MFTLAKDVPVKFIGEKKEMSSQLLSYNDELMVCRMCGKAGTVFAEHSHVQSQITYIISGRMESTVGGEKQILGPGDSVLMPPNVPHSSFNIEDTEYLDIFSPCRSDILGHRS